MLTIVFIIHISEGVCSHNLIFREWQGPYDKALATELFIKLSQLTDVVHGAHTAV